VTEDGTLMAPLDPNSTVAPDVASPHATRAANVGAVGALAGRAIGNYVIEKELGRGGMGVVYAATHRQFSDRRYAVKLISKVASSPLAIVRFEREVEAIGRSRHANLLYATDAGVHEGDPYLVTELVEGYDIGKLLRHHGPLQIPVACEIARQIALGLEFVHQTGMVHRDIKPQNVMLQPSGQIKILDLGLASLLQAGDASTSADGGVVGTPVYMPPEQWRGEPPRPSTDVYAFGCTLFEMLAGHAPFHVPTHGAITALRSAHLESVPPHVTDVAPHVPRDVAELVAECLRKAPEERPQSCSDIVTVLELHAAPIDTTKLFAPFAGHQGGAANITYEEFVNEVRFPSSTPRIRSVYLTVFLGCLVLSLGSLVGAYFGPWSTEAWEVRFDRLGGQAVPRGTGFVVEAVRTVLFLSGVLAVGYLRFQLPLQRLFSSRLHTRLVWCARLVLVVVLTLFLGLEFTRLWFPGGAATGMVDWARNHGIETTAADEVVAYRWYFGYAMMHYAVILGGLVVLPLLQFLLSDFHYVQRSLRLFSLAQRNEPNAMQAVDRLYSLARHFRRLATRYVDTAGLLAIGIQYEYWIGRYTLSESGYIIEAIGMLVTALVMLAILGFILARYAEAIDATSHAGGTMPDHRMEGQVGQFSVFWLMKSAIFSRPSGIAVLSLLLLLLSSSRRVIP
jgi:hypothetical protein